MNKKIWLRVTTVGLLAMGMMAGQAQANLSGNHTDCSGGGTTNPDCATWSFVDKDRWGNVTAKKTFDTEIGITVQASAWNNSGTDGLLQSAYLGTYDGGLGVENINSPEHAVDNKVFADSILFTFTEGPVNLTSFNAGWAPGDSDFSVLAYTGGGAGPASLSGSSYLGLLSKGWTLIGNYNDYGTGAHDFSNTTYSSYWLIGAFNTLVGGPSNGTDAGDDYFKILSLAGCDCTKTPTAPGCGGDGSSVPEPGTLLLMGAGLLGLTRIKARRVIRNAA